VEIKTNESNKNENNLKQLKLCRIIEFLLEISLTTSTFFVVMTTDGLTTQISVLWVHPAQDFSFHPRKKLTISS